MTEKNSSCINCKEQAGQGFYIPEVRAFFWTRTTRGNKKYVHTYIEVVFVLLQGARNHSCTHTVLSKINPEFTHTPTSFFINSRSNSEEGTNVFSFFLRKDVQFQQQYRKKNVFVQLPCSRWNPNISLELQLGTTEYIVHTYVCTTMVGTSAPAFFAN